MNLAWMGWTLPTALFFGGIALALVVLGFLAKLAPANEPRVGLFSVATQRGDRFFLSLLGAAFIHLGWIALAPMEWPLWGASVAVVVYAAAVFRFG
jgi:predicted small integral membrane protein